MKVDIKHLEDLSKLKIEEDQKQKFEKDLGDILQFVESITKLDLPEEDKTMAVKLTELRADEITDKEACDVLSNAPKKLDGCYVTPLVVE